MDMQTIVSKCLPYLLGNFSFVMLLIALVFVLFHKLCFRHVPESEIVYRWVAFFVLGLTGIFTFVMHAYFPEFTARSIGWVSTPFQFEVAVADLALGILGILSFNASFGFRLATVIAATIMLWGDAIGHISQMILNTDFAMGNAGSWFWMDVALPFILLICILKMYREQKQISN